MVGQVPIFRAVELDRAGGLAVTQSGQNGGHHFDLRLGILVAALGFLFQGDDALFQRVQIGQHQFGFDGVGVAHRVHIAFHMGDVAVFKAAQHMDDGVGFADIGQELVAQALALRRAAHQTGNVDEFQLGGNKLARFGHLRQFFQPMIGNGHPAHIGFDGAERIVGRLCRRRLR